MRVPFHLAIQAQPGTRAERHQPTRAFLALSAFGVMVLWLLSPILHSVQVEGFTAQIQIEAIASSLNMTDHANLSYPIHAEYFYTTRLGVIYCLQFLMWVFGTTSDVTFRLLTGISFIAFAGCTLAIGRRYSQVGLLALGSALLLTPGISELGFFFNDNVVSASFAMLGIALLPPGCGRPPMPFRALFARGLCVGIAIGLAILARTDAVLLLPVLAAFAWLEAKRWPDLLVLGGIVALGLLGTITASFYFSGSSVIQAVQIARFFDHLHEGFRSRAASASILILFIGLPNLLVLPIGLVHNFREANLKQIAVLILLPVAFLPYMVLHALEARQFYPLLAPFIAIHGGRGIQWLAQAATGRSRPAAWAATAVVGAAMLVWLAPPVFVPVKDGPRAVLGRLWSPILWFQWQSSIEATLRDIRGPIEQAGDAPRVAVITTQFDSDHYLQLQLWQAGFRPMLAQDAVPGCTGGFEAWRKNGREVFHIRTENPHIMNHSRADYLAALQIQQAFRCPAMLKDTTFYVSDSGTHPDDPLMSYLYSEHPELKAKSETFGWPESTALYLQKKLSRSRLDKFATYFNSTVLLTPEQVADLSSYADATVKIEAAESAGSYPDYNQLMASYGYRFWHPRTTAE